MIEDTVRNFYSSIFNQKYDTANDEQIFRTYRGPIDQVLAGSVNNRLSIAELYTKFEDL